MKKILKVDNVDNFKDEIKEIANKVKLGDIVVFPTETVYGIGASIYNDKAILRVFNAKNRPTNNPLIAHISDFKMLEQIVDVNSIDEISKKLMEKFFPGPFTIILPKKKNISSVATAGNSTIGIRMPANKIANYIISSAGVPIVAPSANVSGKPSGTRIDDIILELGKNVDYIIDGGKVDIGIESTVVKVEEGIVKILRPGYITKEDISKLLENVQVDYVKGIFEEIKKDDCTNIESPGLLHKHYSPTVDGCIIYSEDHERQILKMIKTASEILNKNIEQKICILGFLDDKVMFESQLENKFKNRVKIIYLGNKDDYLTISNNIFLSLRQVDYINKEDNLYNYYVVSGVKKEGLGVAIMNRLIRAVGYNYVEI